MIAMMIQFFVRSGYVKIKDGSITSFTLHQEKGKWKDFKNVVKWRYSVQAHKQLIYGRVIVTYAIERASEYWNCSYCTIVRKLDDALKWAVE